MFARGECALYKEIDTEKSVPAFAAVADAGGVGRDVVGVSMRLRAEKAELTASKPVASHILCVVAPRRDLQMKRLTAMSGSHLLI